MIFPYEIRNVRNVDERLKQYVKDMVLVGPANFCLPKKYINEAKKYLEFEVRLDDVWILGYSASGTNMAHKLASVLCSQNSEKSRKQQFSDELLEASLLTSDGVKPNFISFSEFKGRRFIRTHLPISLLPHDLLDVGCKIIYLARNPENVAESLYISSTNRHFRYSDMPFETYLKLFTKGLCYFGPQLQHIKEAWEFRHRENFLFMFYEDIIKDYGYLDSEAATRQFADFLSVELADKEVKAVVHYMTIDRFVPENRRNRWWNHVSGEAMKKFDDWMNINLRNTDLYFPQ